MKTTKQGLKIAKTITPPKSTPINDWYAYIHKQSNKFKSDED